MFDPPACGPPGASLDAAETLQRQIVLLHGLARDLEDAMALLPRAREVADWWGPAREAVQSVFDAERARLEREIWRLDGVVIQLRFELDLISEARRGGLIP